MAEKEKERRKGEAREQSRELEPWRPFGELEPWPGLFDEWPFGGRLSRLANVLSRDWPSSRAERPLLPAIDVSDDDQRYTITAELPGAKKDDVHVEIHEGMLTIRGEKRSEREEKSERRRYVERSYGSFSRSFRLPPDADADRLEAKFADGVLMVTLPKVEAAKPKVIAIK